MFCRFATGFAVLCERISVISSEMHSLKHLLLSDYHKLGSGRCWIWHFCLTFITALAFFDVPVADIAVY